MDTYDIGKIISEALASNIDISPSDRQEWKMFCCALKVLDYDESTFVALSSGSQKDSRQAWRDERSPGRYKSEQEAKAMIAALAKQAGMDMDRYRYAVDTHRLLEYAGQNGYVLATDEDSARKMYAAIQMIGGNMDYYQVLAGKYGNVRASGSVFRNQDKAAAYLSLLAQKAGISVDRFYLSPAERATPARHIQARPAATCPPAQPSIHPLHISEQQVAAAASRCRETSLYAYLCKWFAPADVERTMKAYRVGASKYVSAQGGRATCYPYISVSGHCIDCKIMHIDPCTGSRKTAPPLRSWTAPDGTPASLPMTWALAEIKQKERRDKWCNFGDHLLPERPNVMVCVVESEKSALILSLAYPQYIWVAVGSLQNLTPERFSPYRGRKITIYPDRDGIPAWSDKARQLAASGYDICIDTTVQRHEGNAKDDLADIVIRSLGGVQKPPADPPANLSPDRQAAIDAWKVMKQRHPHLADWESALDLEPIRVIYR